MAFAGAQNADASKSTFNDVRRNQINVGTIQLASPSLVTASSIINFAASMAQNVQASRQQIAALVSSIETLLKTLDAEYLAGRLLASQTSVALENLNHLLKEISEFVQKLTTDGFMKSLSTKDQRIAQIENYYRRIEAAIASFQISALVNIQDWQQRNDKAREEDQKALHDRLTELESNQNRLAEMLNAQHHSLTAMMVSLQRSFEQLPGGDRERRFFSHSVQYLSTTSGRQVYVENWMITSFDVEFGPEIGSGGYAQVFEGSWNKLRVALKVLRTKDGITPNPGEMRREIAAWSKLSHPHILQFLGANVLDDKPFIVTPYLENGNVRVYIENNPHCDRLKILYHVSLGLVYLHSKNIVHGDLKALNILIDDARNAVLCDFGLSRVKADVASRTTETDLTSIAGSRNWMAPERLNGGALRKPCDIYAFGMVIYEVQTNEIPLASFGFVSYIDFKDLIVRQDIRPERPEDDEAPQMTEDLWQLAERCWTKVPSARPKADAVCDAISSELRDRKVGLTIKVDDHSTPRASPAPDTTNINVDNKNVGTTTLDAINPAAGVRDVENKELAHDLAATVQQPSPQITAAVTPILDQEPIFDHSRTEQDTSPQTPKAAPPTLIRSNSEGNLTDISIPTPLHVGLDNAKDTASEVEELRKRLALKRTQLEAKEAEANDKLKCMVTDRQEAESKKSASVEIQAMLAELEEHIQQRQSIVIADLTDVETAVLEAIAAVRNIKRQHLQEVRAMQNPPEAVKMTMESICTILGHEVDSWRTVSSIIRRDDFIQRIVTFDTTAQLNEQSRDLVKREYFSRFNYDFEVVNRVSKACGPLVKWALAQVQFSETWDKVIPLRSEVESFETEAATKKIQAQEIINMISELEAKVERHKQEYATLISETQVVKGEMERLQLYVDHNMKALVLEGLDEPHSSPPGGYKPRDSASSAPSMPGYSHPPNTPLGIHRSVSAGYERPGDAVGRPHDFSNRLASSSLPSSPHSDPLVKPVRHSNPHTPSETMSRPQTPTRSALQHRTHPSFQLPPMVHASDAAYQYEKERRRRGRQNGEGKQVILPNQLDEKRKQVEQREERIKRRETSLGLKEQNLRQMEEELRQMEDEERAERELKNEVERRDETVRAVELEE